MKTKQENLQVKTKVWILGFCFGLGVQKEEEGNSDEGNSDACPEGAGIGEM